MFLDGTTVAKDYGVLVINIREGGDSMNCSKLGLCGGAVMLLALAAAPLGCENPSSSSGGVTPDGGGVFEPDGGGSPDANVDPVVQSECVPPTKGPTMHGGGSTSDPDETWTADGSPHILPFDTTIYKTVTVEPCAEVLIADGHQITIRNGGKLVAEGTATKRIHFGAKDAGKPFANIRTLAPSTARFAYTTIDGGGKPLATTTYLAGTLDMSGDGNQPTQEVLFVDHVTIDGSQSNGLVMQSNAGFAAGSNALVVKNAVAHPMSVWANAVGGIPVGSYTGNGIDQILLPATSGNETITETQTLHERGVPYLVGHATSGGDLRVDVPAGKPSVTLTIEPGVTMKFKKKGVFRIAVATSSSPARASLIAAGTAAKPIVFTSNEAAPAAGDWFGLWFGDVPSATDKVDQVRVEYAGGTSVTGSGSCPDNSEGNNDAAIRIFGYPPSEFVTNTTILA
ncbi:MAG: Fibronectin type domain protein, partial [Myxococcaceae bacterium]|nr:Fibronectin type domain protein [Myxococcaceae bacterium]